MTPERFSKITNVLNKRQPDLTVITDEIHKQRNIAAILRNCDAVGIDTIHSVMPESGYQIYSGTAASANKWVNTCHYSSIEEPCVALIERGFQLVTANLSDRAIDYREVDYTKPTAVIMGAEVKGVSDRSIHLAHQEIILPMDGMVESYNVSVACALILNEAQYQRRKAGFYDQRRLPEALYKRRFFQWAHPVLAEFCDSKGIDYPEVREDGEVINLSEWYSEASARTSEC